MAFLQETGDGIQDANSYISVEYFQDFHTDRGHVSASSLGDTQVQQCCIRASDYIDKRFGRKFRGIRRNHLQGLAWPRIGAQTDDGYLLADIDEIPRKLQMACAEYALRAAVYNELAPDPLLTVPTQDFGEADLPAPADTLPEGLVTSSDEKADIVEEKLTYGSLSSSATYPLNKMSTSVLVGINSIPEYPAADMLLEELLNNNRRILVRG